MSASDRNKKQQPDFCLAFPADIWDELCSVLSHEHETAGVLLAGHADDPEHPTLLANRVVWVPNDQYVSRKHDGMKIASGGWFPALKQALSRNLQPIFFHTHPGGHPEPSAADQAVDQALSGPFRIRAETDFYASFILGGDKAAPSFSGRVLTDTSEQRIVRARIVGQNIAIRHAFDSPEADTASQQILDRQVRAFGSAGNNVLRDLRIGVVGAGGTGSSVIEQLARMGVRELVVVDDDVVTPTNISRIYGSGLGDVGIPKVDVAAKSVSRIGLGSDLATLRARASERAALELLRTCDVIFGCTDDHTGRYNLSLLAFYYLIPLIDLGIVIDAPGHEIRSITGRITYVAPGEACLVCRGVVDPNVVREEAYSPEERERLAGEGYARGLGEPDPSVIAYTTMVASWGVADLLERLFGFGVATLAGETRLRIADRKMTSRSAPPNPEHVCGRREEWGLGDQRDFLGQRVWVV